MKLKSTLLTTALSVTLSSAASAQVTVVNKFTSAALTTAGLTQFSFTYAPVNPGNTLVFCSYVDNTTTGTAVTFDGVAAEGFVHSNRCTLGYTRTSDASVNIVVTLSGTGNGNSGYVIYELSGVAAGAVDLSSANTITTTADTKFVLSFAGVNNASLTGAAPALGSVIPPSSVAVADWASGSGGGGLAYGHGSAGLTGSQTLGWSFPSGGAVGTVAAAFPSGVNPDADSDGLLDVWEISNFGNITAQNGTGDPDGDGFNNEAEETAQSNPNNIGSIPGDIDGDLFTDTDEITYFGNLVQTPGGDYDGDQSTNIAEITAATSPTNAGIWPDAEPDGMPDGWEIAHGLSATTDDSALDPDNDGVTNLDEFLGGSDPHDPVWTPSKAALAHRWSFTGDLNDSVGNSNALIVNDDASSVGLSSSQQATDVRLFGGGKTTSDYINLGGQLISGLQSGGVKPVTIELWATQDAIQNWARIFDFGSNGAAAPLANESLRMTWIQGTDLNTDQIAWEPTASWGPGNAPYVLEKPYHIVMTIVPALYTHGVLTSGARVSWYSAPSSESQEAGHPHYNLKGTFNTPAGTDLRSLVDTACTLGRSMYGDNTAAATYDEVRIWKGALTDAERKLFQLLGPDDVNRADTDDDGFPDAWETARFGNLTTAAFGEDKDGDGETDDLELIQETDPNDMLSTSVDADKDQLADTWELMYFKNLLQTGTDDPDNDYADNETEELFGTNPNNINSSPDTDGDGISDGWEYQWFLDLTTANATSNSDGDFDSDLQEFQGGFDPFNRFSGRDTENGGAGDGLPDYWEFFYFQPLVGTNYLNIVVPSQDFEPDGATNSDELKDGTDPVDGSSFRDMNTDGIFDGTLLAAGDALDTTSFNSGTNWPGTLAPVTGKNYLVSGLTLRSPAVANQTTIFAGANLVISNGSLYLKGDASTVRAKFLLDGATIRQAEGLNAVTVAGDVAVFRPSVLFADNGALTISAKVTGSAGLKLDGNATAIRAIRFTNAANTWTGDLTVGPTASLIVDGVLGAGMGSNYHIRPGASGVTNSIGGTGAFNLAGALHFDLSTVALSPGASWNVVNSAFAYQPGFTVVDENSLVGGFSTNGATIGTRVWTSGNGSYQFSEATGVLSFVGTVPGYVTWAASSGLTTGVNDGATQNPDNDDYANIIEYQLGGNPQVSGRSLVKVSEAPTHMVFTFERFDASENDTQIRFLWGTDLTAWNTVAVGATSSGPDAKGVIITVVENGGATADYDLIEIQLPKTNSVGGKLFGRIEGIKP